MALTLCVPPLYIFVNDHNVSGPFSEMIPYCSSNGNNLIEITQKEA